MKNNPLRSILFAAFTSIIQASGELCIDRHRLSRLISGKSEMTAEEAARIAETTGTPVSDVIEAARAVRQRAGPGETKSKKDLSRCANTERGKE